MERDKLIKKIERIINRIEIEEDLPLKIKEVYLFGSFLKGKREPDDVDIILVHEKLSLEQAEENIQAIKGYGTTFEQKMNRRLKANAEKMDIVYFTNIEYAKQVYPRIFEKYLRIWSTEDKNWKEKLRL